MITIEDKELYMYELICSKHKIEKECYAGCSAHIDNWYCPECKKEKEKKRVSQLNGTGDEGGPDARAGSVKKPFYD
jgi:hypothetical protein